MSSHMSHWMEILMNTKILSTIAKLDYCIITHKEYKNAIDGILVVYQKVC